MLPDHHILDALCNVYNDMITNIKRMAVVALSWALIRGKEEEILVILVTDWDGAQPFESRLATGPMIIERHVLVVRERLVNAVAEETYVEPVVVSARAGRNRMTASLLLQDGVNTSMLQCAYGYTAKGRVRFCVQSTSDAAKIHQVITTSTYRKVQSETP
jgi:hypothetical protein